MLSIATLISLIIVLLVAFTIHEYAHAWTADQLGDDTPRMHGRLTLNPLVHLDPIGTLMLILTRRFGWAKPVPINPHALLRRSPYGVLLVALAGPLSNLGLAIIAAILLRSGINPWSDLAGPVIPSFAQFLSLFIRINLVLLLFNLIPVAPLDGEKVLYYLLPPSGRGTMDQLRPYGPFLLLGLIFVGPWIGLNLLQWFIGLPADFLYSLLV